MLQEVFRGIETSHTVDDRQFNTSYTGRVRAFNEFGEGPYSEPVSQRTGNGNLKAHTSELLDKDLLVR